jgi:hypothetical protein
MVADYPRRCVWEMENLMETRTYHAHATLAGLVSVARAAVVVWEGWLDTLVEEHAMALRAAERAALARARLHEVRALYMGSAS